MRGPREGGRGGAEDVIGRGGGCHTEMMIGNRGLIREKGRLIGKEANYGMPFNDLGICLLFLP